MIRHLRWIAFLTSLWFGLGVSETSAQRCSAVQYDSVLAKRYPYWKLKRQMIEDSIQTFLRTPKR